MFVRHFFLFFLLCISSVVYALPYVQPCVEEVLEEGQWIKLTDGSLWQVKADYEEVQRWQVGDEIVLAVQTYYVCKEQYFFKNLRLGAFVEVQNDWNQLPKEEALHTIQNIKNRWNENLTLEDQSVWSIFPLSLNRTKLWYPGDKIVIFPALDSQSYYLINFNCPKHPASYAAYLFNKEQIAYKHFIADISFNRATDTGLVKLDNGFIWELKDPIQYVTRDVVNWNIGDEVLLYGDIQDDERPYRVYFALTNLNHLSRIDVLYRQQSEDWHSHRIKKIEKIPTLLFSSETYLTLDDNSIWKVTKHYSHVQKWKIGDRVMVSPLFDPVYVLINPDYGLSDSDTWSSYCYLYSCACVERFQP